MITIGIASENDAEEILAIYAEYVKKTAITFEYEVPDMEEFRGRIRHTLERFPYLVARENGKIVGYAYASPFKARPAYDWAVETSIYVDRNLRRCGIGRKLYGALEATLKKQGILNMNACIAYPKTEDEYLTRDSVKFHEKLGYQMVGTFHQCGYKFHRWYDMVWMEKFIGEHRENQQKVISFPDIHHSMHS